jgi:hypothetical protein
MSAVDFESIARKAVEAERRLCKDCKHCRPRTTRFLFWVSTDYEFAKCAAVEPSLVDGTPNSYCRIARIDYGPLTTCGADGKHWEPR